MPGSPRTSYAAFVDDVTAAVAPLALRIAVLEQSVDGFRRDISAMRDDLREALERPVVEEKLLWGLPARAVLKSLTVVAVSAVLTLGVLIGIGRGPDTAAVIQAGRVQHGPPPSSGP